MVTKQTWRFHLVPCILLSPPAKTGKQLHFWNFSSKARSLASSIRFSVSLSLRPELEVTSSTNGFWIQSCVLSWFIIDGKYDTSSSRNFVRCSRIQSQIMLRLSISLSSANLSRVGKDTNAVSLNLFKPELQFLDESTHLRIQGEFVRPETLH